MTPPVEVLLPRETLSQFADASGDRSPLHGDDDYARTTSFGQSIIHGSLALLTMSARTPLGAQPSPVSVTAIFRRAVLPGATYLVEAGEREDGWRLELLEGGASLISANLRNVDAPSPPPRAPSGCASPMRRDPATPSATELASGAPVYGEYRPDTALLVSLARTFSVGGDVSPAVAAALGWISYVAGMELPGRHSMCRRVDLSIHGAVAVEDVFTSEARVEMFDERTNLLRVTGRLFVAGRSVATCSLGVHWRGNP